MSVAAATVESDQQVKRRLVAGGNHLVIRHEGNEYSFYAHLAYGSIRVKEGQRVVQGEHTAGAGGTGESSIHYLSRIL